MGVEPTPYRETVGHLNRLTLEPKKVSLHRLMIKSHLIVKGLLFRCSEDEIRTHVDRLMRPSWDHLQSTSQCIETPVGLEPTQNCFAGSSFNQFRQGVLFESPEIVQCK